MFCVYWSLIEFQNVRAREGLIIMGLISGGGGGVEIYVAVYGTH